MSFRLGYVNSSVYDYAAGRVALACPSAIFRGILRVYYPWRTNMRWNRAILESLILVLVAAPLSPTATAADVTIFAAASLKEALDEQARQFEAGTGSKVIVSYGASNAL
ncbi:MAG: hypothetical protein M3Z74_08695, partial [Pseudomonadota bacterium]|nr:hypothetical protein [Pseudomonadota bacterium]